MEYYDILKNHDIAVAISSSCASANPDPVLGVGYKSLIQSCWVEAVAYNYPYPEASVPQ